jgi:hypothetical protein
VQAASISSHVVTVSEGPSRLSVLSGVPLASYLICSLCEGPSRLSVLSGVTLASYLICSLYVLLPSREG